MNHASPRRLNPRESALRAPGISTDAAMLVEVQMRTSIPSLTMVWDRVQAHEVGFASQQKPGTAQS